MATLCGRCGRKRLAYVPHVCPELVRATHSVLRTHNIREHHALGSSLLRRLFFLVKRGEANIFVGGELSDELDEWSRDDDVVIEVQARESLT